MTPIEGKEIVQNHFDVIAKDYDHWKNKNKYYYENIKTFINRLVRPGSRVLEVGCATGEVLAATKPKLGVGIDISREMVKLAREKFPEYTFINTSIENFETTEKFDYVIMVDVIDHAYDIMDVFQSIHKISHPQTKIILTTINPWWEPILTLMEKVGAKMPEGPHNFIEAKNIFRVLESLDFSVSYWGYLLLFPKHIPLLSFLANTVGVRVWGLNKFSAVQYMVLQPLSENTTNLNLGCSVVIPCYNEEGSIQEAIRRIPKMGRHTEIVVVNDGSQDQTVLKAKELQKEYPNLKVVDYSPNRGKGYAVQRGFEAASQEVLMILDADLSVPPEELPRFFNPLNKGSCQFVNGTRMVYPMERDAMRFFNLLGNKIFSLAMTFITHQNLTDTLCGTKAFYRKDYQYIPMGRDKWGDFDLLFGTAKLGNKIFEIPVHYKARRTGTSKMKRFQHGVHLLKASLRGFRELILGSGEIGLPKDNPKK